MFCVYRISSHKLIHLLFQKYNQKSYMKKIISNSNLSIFLEMIFPLNSNIDKLYIFTKKLFYSYDYTEYI